MKSDEIGELKLRMSLDADQLHAGLDVIEKRLEAIKAQFKELNTAAMQPDLRWSVTRQEVANMLPAIAKASKKVVSAEIEKAPLPKRPLLGAIRWIATFRFKGK